MIVLDFIETILMIILGVMLLKSVINKDTDRSIRYGILFIAFMQARIFGLLLLNQGG